MLTQLYFHLRARLAEQGERGAGMAEYALLLALVAVALIAGFQGLAAGIGGALGDVVAAL